MFQQTTPEMHFAIQAVSTACFLVKSIQRETILQFLEKEDRSPVTVADFSVQAVVAMMLEETYPGSELVGEESADALRSPKGALVLPQVLSYIKRIRPKIQPESLIDWIDRGAACPSGSYWVLDPVDGTKGFLRGGQFAVALAYLRDGIVQLGVLGCPSLGLLSSNWTSSQGVLFAAARGKGAWVSFSIEKPDFIPMKVSQIGDPLLATLLTSYESSHTNVEQIDTFVKVFGLVKEPIRMDSQAKYGVLAAGKGDLILRFLSSDQPAYKEKLWDQAAGSIIVEEAGGKVSDLDGKALDFTTGRNLINNRGLLVSNAYLHDAALRVLEQIKA